jgi:hypothetical protein
MGNASVFKKYTMIISVNKWNYLHSMLLEVLKV